LSVTIAEMCIGGRFGAELVLETSNPVRSLFGETTGCLLLEVPESKCDALFSLFKDLPIQQIGTVTREPALIIRLSGLSILTLPVDHLFLAWNGPLQPEVRA
jgi:phosphoribosylformylglycinamidine (FGAM) synthase-like enzyme